MQNQRDQGQAQEDMNVDRVRTHVARNVTISCLADSTTDIDASYNQMMAKIRYLYPSTPDWVHNIYMMRIQEDLEMMSHDKQVS